MKLQKVFDIAESQHRSIEEVALERYGVFIFHTNFNFSNFILVDSRVP